MIRVSLKPKSSKPLDESSHNDEGLVMLPEYFTPKDLNDYVNKFLMRDKAGKNYSFYYQNNKIAQQNLKRILAEYNVSNEELMIIEYKPTDRVELLSADTFPEWIRCIIAEGEATNSPVPSYFSGDFDGVIRRM